MSVLPVARTVQERSRPGSGQECSPDSSRLPYFLGEARLSRDLRIVAMFACCSDAPCRGGIARRARAPRVTLSSRIGVWCLELRDRLEKAIARLRDYRGSRRALFEGVQTRISQKRSTAAGDREATAPPPTAAAPVARNRPSMTAAAVRGSAFGVLWN